MIKRLIKIALLTGAAHAFTILTLKIISKQISIGKIGLIGEIDSIFQLIISIIAFGLQLSAVRDIALAENWKKTFHETQVSRNTFALLIIPIAGLFFFKSSYICFLFAPIFALSGDYALYGNGRPVEASLLVFFRVFIPSLAVMVFSFWFKDYIILAYIISTVTAYFITSLLISKLLLAPYWHPPSFKSLIRYLQSFNLGLVSFNSYFIGLGLLVVATNFYNEDVLAATYLGLKLYMVFKGVLRIINQAFVKEMLNDQIGVKVDQLAVISALIFAGTFVIFPESCIAFFFTKNYIKFTSYIQVIGIAALVSAFLTSLTTRSLLKYKDKIYARFCVLAAIVSSVLIIGFSFFYQNPLSIGIALLIGEIVTMVGLLFCNEDIQIRGRLLFLLQCGCLLILPVGIKFLIGDNFLAMFCGMSLFILAGILLFYRNIFVVTN